MQTFIGIDIGGTNTRVGIVNGRMELEDLVIRPSRDAFKDRSEVRCLIEMITKIMDKNKLPQVRAISIGLPSIVSKDGNSAVSTPNVKSLDGLDIVSPIRETFSLPVFLSKDANLLLLYEMWKRNITYDKTVTGIFLGTGIGNAVWANGKMLCGKNNAAGELGHIPVWNNELICSCGNVGCMETIASGKYLEEIAREHFPGTDIHELFAEEWPASVLDEFVDALSIPIATEINIFDPHYAVLGGGIVNMPNFPKQRLTDAIMEKLRKPFPADSTELVFSKGSQEAGVIGAAVYAMMAENKEGVI